MATFTDHKKRDWTVELDAPLIVAVRKDCSIDLTKGESYGKLFDDPVLLADVLAVLCREQIQKFGTITADEFRAQVRGDAIVSGLEAVKEAQLDFSPSRDREALTLLAARKEKERELTTRELIATSAKLDEAAEVVMAELDRFLNDPKTNEKIGAAMRNHLESRMDQTTTLLSSATNLPELLESIQKDSPSAS